MALTTAPGSTRKSMGESPIHPARYHDSLGCIADTHDDSALIVACMDCDCGACVIKEPVSEKSCASSNRQYDSTTTRQYDNVTVRQRDSTTARQYDSTMALTSHHTKQILAVDYVEMG